MKILLTGATGYIGKRLLPALIGQGHKVVCCVRDPMRFHPPSSLISNIQVIRSDFLEEKSLNQFPKDLDGAYYLVHSMAYSSNYQALEKKAAQNFRMALEKTATKHLIYLGGIINDSKLSSHLDSRKNVEKELGKGSYQFTALRSGIIIGSGSASFEIMRDLVEKLPLMIAPKWVQTRCQPIGVADVVNILTQSLFYAPAYGKDFDIGGPDILTYRQMLLEFAKTRKLKRIIITVPVLTPRLSSYWLYFVTATSYMLARALVDSMKVEIVCRDQELSRLLKLHPVPFVQAIENAFKKIESHDVPSSWKDAYASSGLNINSELLTVPTHGCFVDQRQTAITHPKLTIQKIWSLGGETGWLYGNWFWRIRGFMDKLFGGVGLRRGRTHHEQLHPGDTLDFWRVLYAEKDEGRLLLFAEMKLPGEAWLEFKITGNKLIQTATFRPLGLGGRLYWFMVLPFHGFIFPGLLKKLADSK